MAKGGKPCSVCIHKSLAAIDAELVSGRAQKLVAESYSLSPDAVQRHRQKHLRAAGLHGADQSLAPVDGEVDLLSDVFKLRTRLQRLLTRAERDKDIRGALLAVREALRVVEVVGKLTGQIDSGGVRIAIAVGTASSTTATRQRILGKLTALAASEPVPVRLIIEREKELCS